MTKDEIKENVNMTDVLKEYGIEVKRGMCRCPFHNDHKPSMKVHKDGVTCFTCGETWDVFGFVMKMDGCDFKTAFKRLGGEFHPSKNSDYFRKVNETFRALEDKPKDLLDEIRQERKKLDNALRICYAADDFCEWGSSDWQYLKSVQGYLEMLREEGQYDWRVVEKINKIYAGARFSEEGFRENEDLYRMEVNISQIKEVPKYVS
jgi:hypothetical protein